MNAIKAIVLLFSLSPLQLVSQPADSLDFKIGQMIMVGINGQSADEQLLADVRKGNVGGVIFFEKNIAPTNSYINLKQATWALQNASPTKVLIAIDQEGGKVNRLKEKYNFPRSVTASYLGGTASLDSTRFYAEITASTLAGLGFNVNFAPVVDLAVNEKNTVIYKSGRSYGPSSDSVAMHAAEVVQAHRKFGVATVLKHFPGHGSSMADTHYGIADVTPYWDEKELMPYKLLLDSGMVDAVMSAHIVNKSLDSLGLPGTLSSQVIKGLLRDSLHHTGVIFSDDMQMHAIAKHFGLKKAINLSINAGIDVLIFSNNIQNSEERTVDQVHGIIKELIEEGKVSVERIDESYKRIKTLKEKL